MMRSAFSGVNFLVEGESDSIFWKPRLSSENVSIVSCEGKSNLIGAVAAIAGIGTTLVAGIYDADFDRIRGIVHFPTILAVTDENDLETTMLATEALRSVLHEFADVTRLELFERNMRRSVVEHVQRHSYEFGCLRFVNESNAHGVNFDNLSPYRFVSATDWRLDLDALRAEYAKLAGISAANLIADISALCPPFNQWTLVQGHDATRVLAQGLKNAIGRRQLPEEDIKRLLRLAYSERLLHASAMYGSLKIIEGSISARLF